MLKAQILIGSQKFGSKKSVCVKNNFGVKRDGWGGGCGGECDGGTFKVGLMKVPSFFKCWPLFRNVANS